MINYSAKNTKYKNQVYSNSSFDTEYLRISTVEEAKSFFGPISLKERAWRDEMYFNSLLKSPRSRLGIGEHDRAEAYIFGNGSYPEADKEAHKSHFPISVKVMKIDELYISPFEVVDLTAYPDEFPWKIGEAEIYLHLTVNRLILSPQSKLLVKGNVLILNCLEAIGNNIGRNQAIIELTGAISIQHSIASRHTLTKMIDNNGRNGTDGDLMKQESTPLGLRIIEATDSCIGQKGDNGSSGIQGSVGPNGAMLFLSDLRFKYLKGFQKDSIKIKAGAAHGFPGENGSNGGDGGNGGNGAHGVVTPFGIASGFQGGHGGHGGQGGNGGRGGNGGLSCDVFVSVPSQKSEVFQIETSASLGGKGGDGGKGGKGGRAGINGKLYKGASIPKSGKDGVRGLNGKNGKSRCAPKVYLYEHI